MTGADYFPKYFETLCRAIKSAHSELLEETAELLRQTKEKGGRILIAGNGGSAAIAGHAAIDFTKAAGIASLCFNEASLITCLSNDYGYEHWIQKALEFYAGAGDLVILISSSGRSPNMLRAAGKAREMGLPLVTFTGFDPDNPLRAEGKINFWIGSRSYNLVENVHQIWLLAICDWLVGAKIGN
jgi:D-sedoheptulose 7-phosphate isomerase